MPKVKISEFDVNPDNNTDINSINIAEGCAPSGINNAIRQLMSDLKEFQTGAAGDAFTVGGAFAANGGATLGDATGDALTINSSAVSIPNGLNFGSNNLVLSGGNVGIGTSSSTAYANYVNNTAFRTVSSVSDSSTSSGSNIGQLAIDNLDTTANNYSKLAFTTSDGGNRVVASGIYTQVTARTSGNFVTSNMQFWTGTTGAPPAERMRIDSSGNVGIGTSSPAYKLDVSGQSNLNGILIGLNGDTINASGNLLAFQGAGTERMRIDSSGNLLVGTTSQIGSGKLCIVSNAGISLKGDSGSGNSGDIIFYRGDTGARAWGIQTNKDNLFIADDNFSNYAYLSQNPTTWQFASDSRIKKNIQDLSYGLDAVMAIKPRSFDYIATNKHDIGFIAQELKDVIPEAVSGEEIPFDDADTPQERASKTLGVGKETLIPVLVKAIQELNAKVDSLQAELNTLKG